MILSAYDADFLATPWSFVARNEIVVALGDILIVTQADLNSGSMRSVEFALNMNKKIYVLPHQINQSAGTNQLLKEGLAQAIYDIDEFVMELSGHTLCQEKDAFLEYCKNNPNYDEAIKNYAEKTFVYELEGKIKILNGKIYLP